MAKLVFDEQGKHFFETGVSKGVLFVLDADTNTYGKGVAWNGLTSVSQSPEGAEETVLFADNIKYLSLRSAESFNATIEAYTYPDEFEECDGTAELTTGIKIGQQTRKSFGFSYQTIIGNDVNPELGYKIHIIYGATASPSEKAFATVNDSPEAITMSWELSTIPVKVEGFKPTSHLEIDSTKVDPEKLALIEAKLYGAETTEPTLLTPAEILTLLV